LPATGCAAMIKAHPVAGNSGVGAEFLAALRPYIWRRHLDEPLPPEGRTGCSSR